MTQPLKRLTQYISDDKLTSVSLYEIGVLNHLVVICTGDYQKDLLCLGPEHARKVFFGCVKKLKEETMIN